MWTRPSTIKTIGMLIIIQSVSGKKRMKKAVKKERKKKKKEKNSEDMNT